MLNAIGEVGGGARKSLSHLERLFRPLNVGEGGCAGTGIIPR